MRFKPPPRYQAGLFVGLDDPERFEASLVGQMMPQPHVRLTSGEEVLLDQVIGDGFALIAQDLPGERVVSHLRHSLWASLAPQRVSLATHSTPAAPTITRCTPLEAERYRPFARTETRFCWYDPIVTLLVPSHRTT